VVSDSKKMISAVGNYSWTSLQKAILETIENRTMNFLDRN